MLENILPSPLKKKVQFAESVGHELKRTIVPKSRKLIYLNNVPLVTGACYAKWHLPSSSAAEHRGKTHRAPIKEHLVTWDYEKRVELRLTVDKHGNLQGSEIEFEVVQEYAVGAKGERATLGVVKLNLAEYVLVCDETEEPVCRRYLMQESKINSTVKISIWISQIDGERNFAAPPLKSAPIFGNISGVINFESSERDESGNRQSTSSKVNRDIHELRSVYRQTLMAAWSTQDTELPADECIEDIFAGGDGFGSRTQGTRARYGKGKDNDDSEDDRTPTPPASRTNSEYRLRQEDEAHHSRHGKSGHHHRHSKSSDRTIGRGRGSHHNTSSSSDDRREDEARGHGLTEADLREDMRSWQISPPE